MGGGLGRSGWIQEELGDGGRVEANATKIRWMKFSKNFIMYF